MRRARVGTAQARSVRGAIGGAPRAKPSCYSPCHCAFDSMHLARTNAFVRNDALQHSKATSCAQRRLGDLGCLYLAPVEAGLHGFSLAFGLDLQLYLVCCRLAFERMWCVLELGSSCGGDLNPSCLWPSKGACVGCPGSQPSIRAIHPWAARARPSNGPQKGLHGRSPRRRALRVRERALFPRFTSPRLHPRGFIPAASSRGFIPWLHRPGPHPLALSPRLQPPGLVPPPRSDVGSPLCAWQVRPVSRASRAGPPRRPRSSLTLSLGGLGRVRAHRPRSVGPAMPPRCHPFFRLQGPGCKAQVARPRLQGPGCKGCTAGAVPRRWAPLLEVVLLNTISLSEPTSALRGLGQRRPGSDP